MPDAYADIVLAGNPDWYAKFQDVAGTTLVAAVGANGTYYNAAGNSVHYEQEALRVGGKSVRFPYRHTAGPVYARVPGAANYTNSDFTIEFWIRPYFNMGSGTYLNRYPCILYKGAYLTKGWYLQVESGISVGAHTLHFRTNQGAASQVTTSANNPLPEGKRIYVVIDRQGATVRMFFDIIETAYAAQGTHADPLTSSENLWIGSYINTAAMYAQMGISDLAFYPRRLSEVERAEHYSAGHIASVAPPEPKVFESWTKSPSNPIIIPTQAWEGDCVMDGSVIKEAGVYYSYYCAATTVATIGYATASPADYPLTWTKYGSNPVVSNDATELGPASPKVYKLQDGSFRMFYQSMLSNGKVEPRYANATAGGFPNTWTKGGVSAVSCGANGEWDSVQIQAHEYIPPWESYDGLWHMFYGGYDGWCWRVGHATSADGATFTKDAKNPIMFPGGAAWKQYHIIPFSMTKFNNYVYLCYGGSNDDHWQIGYAFADYASDLSKWEVTDAIIIPSGSGGWEAGHDIEGATVYWEEARGQMELFFLSSIPENPTQGGGFYRMGLATRPNPALPGGFPLVRKRQRMRRA